MTLAFTWHVFDVLGTIAFALSGTMVGLSRKMDVFGVTVLAVLTAVGGGIVRDLMIGIAPPTALTNTTNLLLAVSTAIILSLIYGTFHITPSQKRRLALVFHLSDTIGLGAFTVTGVITGLTQKDAHFTLPILLGLLTAVGGGVLRDVLAQRMPTVLYADFYAVASVAGSFIVCLASQYQGGLQTASWAGFFVVVVLRICAIRFGWQVYHPRPGKKKIGL